MSFMLNEIISKIISKTFNEISFFVDGFIVAEGAFHFNLIEISTLGFIFDINEKHFRIINF